MVSAKLYKSLIFAIIFILLCSCLFYHFEKENNDKINSLQDSLWWGFVTSTTVGYGDIYPVTQAGRRIAVLLMLIGIGIFGFITASFASIFVEEKLKKGMGLMDVTFNNHIIIIGWNYRSKSIIEELLNEDSTIKIVLIDKIDQNPYVNKNISYIKGDATSEKTLNRANIKNAKIAIILADKNLEDHEMIDGKTVLVALAIDRLNSDIYLVSEVSNHSNIVHFERINVNDIIISNEIESKVLVRSVLYKGVSKAFKELITNSYGNELYQSGIPENYVGLTYEKVAFQLLEKRGTLIGIYRNDHTYLNPSKNLKLKQEDDIVYIANKKLPL